MQLIVQTCTAVIVCSLKHACMHARTHACPPACPPAHPPTHPPTRPHACACALTCTRVRMHACTHTHACMRTRKCVQALKWADRQTGRSGIILQCIILQESASTSVTQWAMLARTIRHRSLWLIFTSLNCGNARVRQVKAEQGLNARAAMQAVYIASWRPTHR